MKYITYTLWGLLLLLQYQLWLGQGGLIDMWRLKQSIGAVNETIKQRTERNAGLQGEVQDLKGGLDAIEERARSELGMVKQGEVFYQVVDGDKGTK